MGLCTMGIGVCPFQVETREGYFCGDEIGCSWESPKRERWAEQKIRIKTGWYQAGKTGRALTEPFFSGQAWIVILWDDEEDPDLNKLAGIEKC